MVKGNLKILERYETLTFEVTFHFITVERTGFYYDYEQLSTTTNDVYYALPQNV